MYPPYSSNDLAPIHFSEAVLSSTGGSTWLSSWWIAGLVTAVCLVVAGFLLFFHRPFSRQRCTRDGQPRPKTRYWAGAGARIAGALLLVAVAGVFLANAYVGYVPNLTAGGRVLAAATGQGSHGGAPGSASAGGPGAVNAVALPGDSKLLVAASDAWVYTPPGYDASGKTRYPVMYLIHGFPGTAADWFAAGQVDQAMDALIARNMVKPMIVVALDVNGGGQRDTECLDAVNGPKIESWIYTQAIPFIDKTFPTQPDRSGRILGGMSSGGYCALDQGLRHQDTWSTIIAFEAYGNPGKGGKTAFNGNQALIKAHSPSDYLPSVKFTHPQAFYLDNGDRSGVARVKKLAEQLKSRQQKVYYRINAGQGHTWSEVRAGLPYALVFASRELQGP